MYGLRPTYFIFVVQSTFTEPLLCARHCARGWVGVHSEEKQTWAMEQCFSAEVLKDSRTS